jgi:hypothetical protein
VQVNYGQVEESALNFVIKQTCDNDSIIWGEVFKHDGRGEANSRLVRRNRSPSAGLEEATVYSTMDEKTFNGSLISSSLERFCIRTRVG